MLTTRETCIRRFVHNIYQEIQGKKSQKMIDKEKECDLSFVNRVWKGCPNR